MISEKVFENVDGRTEEGARGICMLIAQMHPFQSKKTARIRNRYNQEPNMSQDNNRESNKITINITNKSEGVSPILDAHYGSFDYPQLLRKIVFNYALFVEAWRLFLLIFLTNCIGGLSTNSPKLSSLTLQALCVTRCLRQCKPIAPFNPCIPNGISQPYH